MAWKGSRDSFPFISYVFISSKEEEVGISLSRLSPFQIQRKKMLSNSRIQRWGNLLCVFAEHAQLPKVRKILQFNVYC